jgi:hypothetical protein
MELSVSPFVSTWMEAVIVSQYSTFFQILWGRSDFSERGRNRRENCGEEAVSKQEHSCSVRYAKAR